MSKFGRDRLKKHTLMFTQIDVYHFLTWLVFVYWQITSMSSSISRKWYEEGRKGIALAPPGYIFPIVWSLILYPLLVATAFIFFREANQSEWTYLWSFIVFSLNIVLNKVWSVAFFDMHNRALSIALGVLLIVTSVVAGIFMLLDNSYTLWWFHFITFSLYGMWLLFALYLTVRWEGRLTSDKSKLRTR